MLLGKKTYHNIDAGPMVDIHCHVLPGVDDGADFILESIRMLRMAVANGITDIIVTPHYKANHHSASPESIYKKLADLRESVEYRRIPIRLYPGNEIMYYSGVVEDLDKGKVLTLAETDHVLVEFKPGVYHEDIRRAMMEIWEAGYQPILAHVERYECMVRQPEYAIELSNMGIEIQTNYDAVMGGQGSAVRKCIQTLLDERVIDYLGTDAHNSTERTPQPGSCIAYLYKHYEKEYVEAITYRNGKRLIEIEDE